MIKSKSYGLFKEALRGADISTEVINSLSGEMKIASVLDNPFKLIPIIEELGIPPKEYFGNSLNNLPLSRDFIWGRLIPGGAERIRKVGEACNGIERAKMLAEVGERESIASLREGSLK